MNKYFLLPLLLTLVLSCNTIQTNIKIKNELENIFPSTEKTLVSNTKNSINIILEDENFILDSLYLNFKLKLICYSVLNIENSYKKINIQIIKGDSVFSNILLSDNKELSKNYYLFHRNPLFLEFCKIVFSEFDMTEFWNYDHSLRSLSTIPGNKELGFTNLFDMLYAYSNECNKKIKNDKIETATLLKEGIKLINSAGMYNFWNQEESVNSKELISHVNQILDICNSGNITNRDSISFTNGIHLINEY